MLTRGKRVYYGWYIVIAASGIEFTGVAAAISILTVFVNPMVEEFGWSRTQFAGAASAGTFLGVVVAPLVGRMVDSIGSRRILTVSGSLVVLCCFYLAMVHSLLGFYLAIATSRVAYMGSIQVATATAVGKWFQRYRGRAVAIMFFAGAIGIVIIAPLMQLVISLAGWRAAWLVLGGMLIVLGVIPSALIMRRQPEDMGLPIDGIAPAGGQGPPGQTAALPQNPQTETSWEVKEALRTAAFWLLILAIFGGNVATAGVGFYLMPHLVEQGLTPGTAVGAVSILATFIAIGSLVWGQLAERIPPRVMMAIAYVISGVGIGILVVADTLWMSYLFAGLQGLALGGMSVQVPVLWAIYYGRERLGTLYGLARGAQVAGLALGPLISGMAYDTTGSYQGSFIYFSGAVLLGAVLVLMARKPERALAGAGEPAVLRK